MKSKKHSYKDKKIKKADPNREKKINPPRRSSEEEHFSIEEALEEFNLDDPLDDKEEKS